MLIIITILQQTNTTSVISKCGKFSPFLSFYHFTILVILFLVLSSNFIVSFVKSSRLYPFFILNVILFLILLIYICIEGYLYFLHVSLKYIENNLEYWILNKTHL